MKKILKRENGSITLFVLVSMLFMAMFLITIYTLSTNNEIAARNVRNKLKEKYEIGLDRIDDIYYELEKVKAYDQYGNEIVDFLDNWHEPTEYKVDRDFKGYGIKYKGAVDEGRITGEVPYYIRIGEKEAYVVSYVEMFKDRTDINKLNLSDFNTKHVINMANMFDGCTALTELKINSTTFDTSNVTTIAYMFRNCSSLTELDVSKWDTSKVTKMNYTFAGCSSLTELDVSGFSSDNLEYTKHMFNGCSKLEALDLTGFTGGKIIEMNNMFTECAVIKKILLPDNFVTSTATKIYEMFSDCKLLTTLNNNLNTWDLSNPNLTSLSKMFASCTDLVVLDISKWNTSNITTMENMFYNCRMLGDKGTLDLSGWNTSNVTNMSSMFSSCTRTNKLILGPNFDMSKVTSFADMFKDFASNIGITNSTINVANATTYAFLTNTVNDIGITDRSIFVNTSI